MFVYDAVNNVVVNKTSGERFAFYLGESWTAESAEAFIAEQDAVVVPEVNKMFSFADIARWLGVARMGAITAAAKSDTDVSGVLAIAKARGVLDFSDSADAELLQILVDKGLIEAADLEVFGL